jgi:hypothetical protein
LWEGRYAAMSVRRGLCATAYAAAVRVLSSLRTVVKDSRLLLLEHLVLLLGLALRLLPPFQTRRILRCLLRRVLVVLQVPLGIIIRGGLVGERGGRILLPPLPAVEGAAPAPPSELPAQLDGIAMASLATRKRCEMSSWCESSRCRFSSTEEL